MNTFLIVITCVIVLYVILSVFANAYKRGYPKIYISKTVKILDTVEAAINYIDTGLYTQHIDKLLDKEKKISKEKLKMQQLLMTSLYKAALSSDLMLQACGGDYHRFILVKRMLDVAIYGDVLYNLTFSAPEDPDQYNDWMHINSLINRKAYTDDEIEFDTITIKDLINKYAEKYSEW